MKIHDEPHEGSAPTSGNKTLFSNISIHSVSVVCVVWDETREVVIFNFFFFFAIKSSLFLCVRDVFFFYNNRNSGWAFSSMSSRVSAQTSAYYDFCFSLDAISHACDHHNVSKAPEAELGTQKTQHTESLNLEWDGRKFIVGSTWWCDCCFQLFGRILPNYDEFTFFSFFVVLTLWLLSLRILLILSTKW